MRTVRAVLRSTTVPVPTAGVRRHAHTQVQELQLARVILGTLSTQIAKAVPRSITVPHQMAVVLIFAPIQDQAQQHATVIVGIRSTPTAKDALQSTTVFRRMAGATRRVLTLGLD